ncbi:sigma-54 interaction domain-containing protein [Anaerosalibacter massiliensis]|uniref:Sigma 54-interacting transcriptional regulator n=1 Tax=Anaerosalibacter massiliensis TaxID=1347392 RepID=A0A9X2S770_9FIRM|nr:sigma 54-interacting transcriptional regulator [Anaerosalibacter massiliensis]MCR2044447.1 sigma 54-interacting transcriptional regulator [Anaerosalibacter massiliensis]
MESKMYEDYENYKLLFDEILDMTEDGFVVTDIDGTILEMNKSYCDFLGTTKEEAIGKHIGKFIKNTKMPEIAATGKKEVDVIHEFANKEKIQGDDFLLVTRAPVKRNGKVIAAVAQVKFRFHTIKLAEKLRVQDQELKYYRDELRRLGEDKFSDDKIIGNSKEFEKTKRLAEKASNNNLPVLITGETGTGKEVFANYIHYASDRKDKPLISINCAAIPEELLESELFGYEEGAFTGAKKGGKKGKFQLANGGTIFLDEIGDMPMHMQAKLLRVLQENEVERIGGYKPTPIDVRVISATNQDLKKLVEKKKFREDLYYRLNVINVHIPPLRQRPEDIELFVNKFLDELNRKYKTNTSISPKAMELLKNHTWPGNVRELKNVVESAYALGDNEMVGIKQLSSDIITSGKKLSSGFKGNDLDLIINEFEKEIILDYLVKNDYNVSKTANELGIHRTTLYNKFKKLNIKISKDIKIE